MRRWLASLWWVPVTLAALVAAALLSTLASTHPYFAWDVPVAEAVRGFAPPGMGGLMELADWTGNRWVAAASYLVVLALAVRWRGWPTALLVLGVALLDQGNEVIKTLVGRPRPGVFSDELDSFPSGHVVHMILLLGVAWLLAAPRVGSRGRRAALAAVLALMALLVGISRVYLERHWPSDVVGGLFIGGLVVCGVAWVWRRPALARRAAQARRAAGPPADAPP